MLRVTGICAVATLGIYGASKDKKWPLIAVRILHFNTHTLTHTQTPTLNIVLKAK